MRRPYQQLIYRGVPMNQLLIGPPHPSTSLRSAQHNDRRFGGEDRNRTYPATCVATTVLKTARATRHPSLSGSRKTPKVRRRTSNADFFAREGRFGLRRLDVAFENRTLNDELQIRTRAVVYFAFLIALAISSNS